MISFSCDYLEGAHPRILERLFLSNMEQHPGYGQDRHCEHARQLISKACGRDDLDIHFMVGGTQTNMTVISSVLRPYQGVVCAQTAHINVHETGAIEHSGHKVMTINTADGLLSAEQVRDKLASHYADPNIEHTVQPGMVYLSMPSELGTIYTKQQLTDIAQVCKEYSVPLYIDGARLGYGLCSDLSDMTLADIARIADIFYIGGTKQGALMGEALVIANKAYSKDFRYNIKQNGGLLAKGRLLGLQFEALFEDELYWQLSVHANHEAKRIHDALVSKGYELYTDAHTNQILVYMSAAKLETLSSEFGLDFWWREDDRVLVRICTSWATKSENTDRLIAAL